MSFEQFGLEFVSKGAKAATKQVHEYVDATELAGKSLLEVEEAQRKANKEIEKAEKQIEKNTKSTDKMTKSVEKSSRGISGMVDKFIDMLDIGNQVPPMIANIASSLSGLLAGALGVASAGIAAFVALGVRGAGLRGIEEAFHETFERIGVDSDNLLQRMSNAADGMLRETNLMRRATGALTGATGEVATEFANKLPELLEVAQAAARATGEDFNFLFDSLVRGVKRGSPLLIDNAELSIDGAAAMQAYADEVGVSVDQLTTQQRQLATLNAVLAQGAPLVEANARANETASDKIARLNATIADLLDTLSVNVQPAFEVLLDWTQMAVDAIASIVTPIANTIGAILRLFQLGIQEVGRRWAFLPGVVRQVFDLIIDFLSDFGTQLVTGAGRMWAAFINTINHAKVLAVRAVADMAEAIADFLVGSSPPPKGALSRIDEGGRNTMQAWIGGLTSVSVQPVTQVANEVATLMGDVANMSLAQVEKRLKQLDNAIKPFSDRLKIIEARLKAIQEPAEAAIRSIQRQQERLMQAFASGDKQAAQLIRQMDSARESIQRNIDAQERQVDLARVQLALAQAAQAEERAKLEIRRSEFELNKKVEKVEKAREQRIDKERKERQKTGATGATGGAGGAGGASGASGELPTIGGEGRVDRNTRAFLQNLLGGIAGVRQGATQVLMDFSSGFGDELNQDLIADLASEQERLSAARTSIQEGGGLGGVLGTAFSNMGTALDENLISPIEERVGDFIGFFNDPSREGSIAAFFADVQENGLGSALGLDGFADSISTWFENNLSAPIDNILFNLLSPASMNSIPSWFSTIQTDIQNAVGDLQSFFTEDIWGGIRDWIMGDTDNGGLPNLISEVGRLFGEIPVLLGRALQNIGIIMWNAMVVPIIEAINSAIGQINTFLANVVGNEQLQRIASLAGIDLPTFQIGTINNQPPAALTTPFELPSNPNTGARRGGIFSGGAINVGESGREVMASAQPFAVFSNEFVRAIDTFADVVSTMSVNQTRMATNNVVNDNSVTINNNGTGGMNRVSAARIAMLRNRR